jgi:hypothetical protein
MESDIGLFFGGTKVVKKVRGRWGDLSDFSDGAKGRVGEGEMGREEWFKKGISTSRHFSRDR